VASEVDIPGEYEGWWRIVETSQWGSDDLDICGTALLSLTGRADRLRLLVLLAYVNCGPTKTGVSFTWEGAWEFDQAKHMAEARRAAMPAHRRALAKQGRRCR
jgi:hypothetical protein